MGSATFKFSRQLLLNLSNCVEKIMKEDDFNGNCEKPGLLHFYQEKRAQYTFFRIELVLCF